MELTTPDTPLAPSLRAQAIASRLPWSARRIAVVVVGVVTAARLVAAFAMHGPTLLPDEYFYTAISRSIAGGGLPTVRGGPFTFVSVLGPLLTAPAWLVHDVAAAYRIAQAEGVLAMSLAAFPAYALARRLSLSERSAATASVFAVLVPDMGFSAFLMTEPVAYPLFLLTILLAVDALAEPTARREALFVGCWVVLCLARVQFFFLEPLYLLVGMQLARGSGVRGFVRARGVALAVPATVLAAVVVLGPHALVGQYSALRGVHHDPMTVARWSVLNLVVAFVAAGWVTIPGAALGLTAQLRGGDKRARGFAALTVLLTGALVGEAGVFGAGLGQLEERYTFYAVPLLLIAFLAAAESGLLLRKSHAFVALFLVAACVFLPLQNDLFTALRDQAPVLAAFAPVQRHADWIAPLIAGAGLLVLALVALELGRRGRVRGLVAVAASLCVAASVGFALNVIPETAIAAESHWHVDLHGTATYLASSKNTVPDELMTALFWNPQIKTVLALHGRSADYYKVDPVALAPGGRIATAAGPVTGAIVVDPSLQLGRVVGGSVVHSGRFTVVPDASRVRVRELLDGFVGSPALLAPTARIDVAAPRPDQRVATTVSLRLARVAGEKQAETLDFSCSNGYARSVALTRPQTFTLPLEGTGVAWCRASLASGVIRWQHGRPVTLRVLSLRLGR